MSEIPGGPKEVMPGKVNYASNPPIAPLATSSSVLKVPWLNRLNLLLLPLVVEVVVMLERVLVGR